MDFKFPDEYNGSALNYIDAYIIPSLPDVQNVISFHNSIKKYINSGKLRYVRKFGVYSSRGRIYSNGQEKFTVTDNEPAVWTFMQAFENESRPFEYYEKGSAFPVAFALKTDEKQQANNRFNYGKQTREKQYSSLGLKHCHILDCSPRRLTLSELTLAERMMRLMSPMNHFHFPSPRKFDMTGGDIGEDTRFQGLLKSRLYDEYYQSLPQKESFISFILDSGSEVDFNLFDDFEIHYERKGIGKSIINADVPKIENNISQAKRNLEKEISGNSKVLTYFKVSKAWFDKGLKIRVNFNSGRVVEYSHDEVFRDSLGHLESLNCWEKYGYFSSTNSIPNWARANVKDINSD